MKKCGWHVHQFMYAFSTRLTQNVRCSEECGLQLVPVHDYCYNTKQCDH
jgi:hypothetical protein